MYHSKPNCAKPSQDPKVTGVRDRMWEKKKPHLFFDSRRHLHAHPFSSVFLSQRGF